MFGISLENVEVQNLLTILASIYMRGKYPSLTDESVFEEAQAFIKVMYSQAGLEWQNE